MAGMPESITINHSALYKLVLLSLKVLELAMRKVACNGTNSLRLTTIDAMSMVFVH